MTYCNTVLLMGHMTEDPVLKATPGGESVLTFGVGYNPTRKDGSKLEPEFFRCEVWGGWARTLSRTARKGALVVVEGRLKQDRWTDAKTGLNREQVMVLALRVFHVERPPRDDDEASGSEQRDGSSALASAGRHGAPGPGRS